MGLTCVPQHSYGGQRAFMGVSSLFPASGPRDQTQCVTRLGSSSLPTGIVLWPQKETNLKNNT